MRQVKALLITVFVLTIGTLLTFSGCVDRGEALLEYQNDEMRARISGSVGGVEVEGEIHLTKWERESGEGRTLTFLPERPEGLMGSRIIADGTGRVTANIGGVSVELADASGGVGISGLLELFMITDEPLSIESEEQFGEKKGSTNRQTKLVFTDASVWLSSDGYPVRIESKGRGIFIDIFIIG